MHDMTSMGVVSNPTISRANTGINEDGIYGVKVAFFCHRSDQQQLVNINWMPNLDD